MKEWNKVHMFLQNTPDDAEYLFGIDEVGRGPIAGPVTLGLFGVHRNNLAEIYRVLSGITDSKKLSEKRREYYADQIKVLKREDLCIATSCSVGAKSIDQKGISSCIISALQTCLQRLKIDQQKSYLFLDGGLAIPGAYSGKVIVGGDAQNWLIGAASVLAKVRRDHYMIRQSEKYPEYFFHQHKGYGTKLHYGAIRDHGLCALHRKTWIKTQINENF